MNYTDNVYFLKSLKCYEIIHNCGGCNQIQNFVNTNCFRVNANGNRIDAWLIYQCKKCKHTLNVPIFERIDKSKIDSVLYQKMIDNSKVLANSYGTNYGFLKSKGFEIDRNSAEFAVFDSDDNIVELDIFPKEIITIKNISGIKIKPEKLLSLVFNISRTHAKKLLNNTTITITQNHNIFKIDLTNI